MAKVYNFDDGHFSNLHKIAYGFRPKTDDQQVWDCLSDDHKQEWWDVMCRIMYAGGAK